MDSLSQTETFALQRELMVQSQLRTRGLRDHRVLDAMLRVPRHEFVPEGFRHQAYEDHPIPIGEGQTVSQPYIVGLMLQALELQHSDVILEIGTGSGYQTALLAELGRHVYSVERIQRLAMDSGRILKSLGYQNITIAIGDGSQGLIEYSPYDAVVVSAAAPQVPSSLFEQLRDGGRMIVPVGAVSSQELQLIRKRQGCQDMTLLEACRFVPLIGGQGYPDLQ